MRLPIFTITRTSYVVAFLVKALYNHVGLINCRVLPAPVLVFTYNRVATICNYFLVKDMR